MKDSELLAGDFFDLEIPKEKRYLLKYFKSELQVAFLKYYIVFGEVANFVDHTGVYCQERTKWKMQARYKQLTEVYKKAKSSLTEEGMALVQLIETGKYRFTKS